LDESRAEVRHRKLRQHSISGAQTIVRGQLRASAIAPETQFQGGMLAALTHGGQPVRELIAVALGQTALGADAIAGRAQERQARGIASSD
jgi:hypothetical protein